jgi:RimJ/RimL family protein N-acetyltransferase/aminoglycoside phosphotransferase (APT) family kinase protein
MTIAFRPLRKDDFLRLARWQARPHVARWWREPDDLVTIAEKYTPSVEGRDPTEVFVIEFDGAPVGLIQRYRMADHPDWVAAVGFGGAAGIDYYLGEEDLIGRGIGSRAIATFARETLTRYPDVPLVIAAPQQANVASWRALEKAGFERLWAGQPDSDDPSDAGPAYVYGLRRRQRSGDRVTGAASASPPAGSVGPRWRHPNQRELGSLPVELRRPTVPPSVRSWVASRAGARVVRTRRLAGASSTAVHGLYLSDGRRLVLRRYAWPGFLDAEPVAPYRELDALRFAFVHGLPVPEVVAADLRGHEVGDGVPVLLMTFLAGKALAVPDLDRLAQVAAAIHDVDPCGLGHDYFPWYEGTATGPPPGSRWAALWEAAVELWREALPAYRPTLIHRDFHPGNVLWSRGRVSGVVDWANACRGPRGCDVAHCRANLIDLGGPEAAEGFLDAYRSLTGEEYDPYWELASILEHGPSHWTPQRLATAEPRLARAVRSMTSTATKR